MTSEPQVEDGPPLRVAPMVPDPAWFDYNGHLNMAYYNVLTDRCVDALFDRLGIGEAYAATRRLSTFTVEAHVRYLRELRPGDPVAATARLLARDEKRLRLYLTLSHAEEGWLSATSESLSLHVDLDARRAAPFPDDASARIDAMLTHHAALPIPDAVGRGIVKPALG